MTTNPYVIAGVALIRRAFGLGFLTGGLFVFILLSCTGCATRVGVDNVASGGGSFMLETFRCDPGVEPIGGNSGNVQNTSSRGGSVDADR